MPEYTTPIMALYQLISRLLGIKAERRKNLFDELLKPLFDKFMEVNKDYVDTFRDTLRNIPLAHSGIRQGEWFVGDKDFREGSPEFSDHLQSLKRTFLEKREEREAIRNLVRHDAHKILAAVKQTEERQFLLSLIDYFIGDNERPYLPDANYYDALLERIQELGGTMALRTPSSELANKISDVQDPNELRELFRDALASLNQRFVNVCSEFTRLHLAIIVGTASGK
jgi:hypothetical protein